MGITQFSMEKNRFTLLALLCLSVAGVFGYINAPKAEDPGFTVRTAVVVSYYPGATPERLEQLVSKPLEEEIQEIPEVERVRSESRTGVSIVYVDVAERYNDMTPIWDELRNSVETAARGLPEQVIGPFVNDKFGDVFGTIITITGEGLSPQELEQYADDLKDMLVATPEAAQVSIHGVQQRKVYIDYSESRLAELGLTPFQLRELVRAQNIVLPGGEVYTDWERITLTPSGNFERIEDLRNLVIPIQERGELVFLGDIAEVKFGYEDPARTYVHSSGAPAVAVAVSLREGGNISELGRDVHRVVDQYRNQVPLGVELEITADQAFHVRERVNSFMVNIVQAMITIMAVMLIAIGVRMGLVVTSLVPVTILTTLFLLPMFDIGIDQVSLASIIIALGMLVDNSIVIAESTMVLVKEGASPRDAAVKSARELGMPLLISSLIICAAFLPALLAEHSLSEYASPVFWGVSITLLASWVFSITMTPLLSARYLQSAGEAKESKIGAAVQQVYRRVLDVFLHHRVLVLAGLCVALVVAGFGAMLVPRQFFPNNDRAVITVELEYATGTSLQRTTELVKDLERFYQEEHRGSGVESWTSFIGGGAPRFYLPFNPEPARPEYAVLIVNLTQHDDMEKVIGATNSFLENTYPEVRVRARPLVLGPPVEAPIEVRISGEDEERIFALAESVRSRMRETSGVYGVRDDWGPRTKQLKVLTDDARAKAVGVTSQEVALSLQTALSGLQVSEYRGEDKIIPITLRAGGNAGAGAQQIEHLETVQVYSTTTGNAVPLTQVASLELDWMPSRIMRRDLTRTVTLQGDLRDGYNAIEISEQLDAWLQEESRNWPAAYSYEIAGEAEATTDANRAIFEQLPLAALLMLLLLVGQFNSIRKTFLVLLTIPFGLIGVVFGLLVTQATFGVMTLLGVISLAGIVVKNAVVLLDRIKIEIEENGLTPYDAVITACTRRVRPILLTTATTIFGLLPLWFGGSPLWESMTIAVIFGLAFSTLLTLGFVPAMYTLLYKVEVPSQG